MAFKYLVLIGLVVICLIGIPLLGICPAAHSSVPNDFDSKDACFSHGGFEFQSMGDYHRVCTYRR